MQILLQAAPLVFASLENTQNSQLLSSATANANNNNNNNVNTTTSSTDVTISTSPLQDGVLADIMIELNKLNFCTSAITLFNHNIQINHSSGESHSGIHTSVNAEEKEEVEVQSKEEAVESCSAEEKQAAKQAIKSLISAITNNASDEFISALSNFETFSRERVFFFC